MLTDSKLLEHARAHQAAGRWAEAEMLYRRLLAAYPGHPDLLDALGVALHRGGQGAAALPWFEAAIAAGPGVAQFHNNLGLLLADLGRGAEALAVWERAIALEPGLAALHYNLGNGLAAVGRAEAAIEAYRTALRLRPDHPETHLNLGNALLGLERYEEAAAAYAAAKALAPQDARAHYNLGNVWRAQGRGREAIAAYRAALRCEPAHADAHLNLGATLLDCGRCDAGIAVYRAGLARHPEHLALATNLASALKDQGDLDGALQHLRRCVALDPGHSARRSNLILASYYDASGSSAQLAAEHGEWRRHHAEPLRAEIVRHSHERSPERVLRVGYVSPDLRDHVVGRTLLPVFERHDARQFEIVAYSGSPVRDAFTERFRARAALWRDTARWSDRELAERVREDGIDILVDLALHTAGSRLEVFARKPAPVQVAWLGYPGSTGLDTMDYALTDPHLDPPGLNDAYYTEHPWRLPECWCCYLPSADAPAPGEPPTTRTGRVTFGSLNNFCKINRRTLEVWARILREVEGSRLRLLAPAGRHRHRTREYLATLGVAPERVEFFRFEPPPARAAQGGARPGYLHRYAELDIALDPFPYNGMTTTCDALWMGVPVVTRVGRLPVARAGLSLLATVGLPEFAAATEDEYVRLAVALAGNRARLTALRGSLRERMQASPLLDAGRLAGNIEAAWRAMWRRWCADLPPGEGAPASAS